jgi:drug/metabolite transporter (DMT)-like permease
MKSILLILTSVFLGVCGQLLLKKGMSIHGRIAEISIPAIASAFMHWQVLVSFACYGISSALWVVVLSREKLSFAYPLVSMGYIFVVFFSSVLYQEVVTPVRWAGVILICLGVVLVSRGG